MPCGRIRPWPFCTERATVRFPMCRRLILWTNVRWCGLRIHGDASRGMYPQSFNLYARNQYGGNGLFGAYLFDTSYFAEAVILDSGGNDRFSKMRDVLVSWLAKDRAFSTMRFKPYAMFLNGEYWGVYWITEKYDPAYLAHY